MRLAVLHSEQLVGDRGRQVDAWRDRDGAAQKAMHLDAFGLPYLCVQPPWNNATPPAVLDRERSATRWL
jgi:hypothetical protein